MCECCGFFYGWFQRLSLCYINVMENIITKDVCYLLNGFRIKPSKLKIVVAFNKTIVVKSKI